MLTPQPKRSLQSSRVTLAVLSVSLLLHALVWWSLLKASPPPAMPERTIEVSLAPHPVAVAPRTRPKPQPPAPRPKVVVHKPRTLVNRIDPPKPHLAQRPVVLPPVPPPQVEPTEPPPVIQPEPTIVAPARPERTTPIVAKKVTRVPQKIEAPEPVPAKKPVTRPVAPATSPVARPVSQPSTTNPNPSTSTGTGTGTGSGSGSGTGSGNGSGSGSGEGSSEGSGKGSGSGSGTGSGEGSGKGSGQGSGEGSGSGSGTGSGKGSGNGDGNGEGSGSGGGDGGSGGGGGGGGGGGRGGPAGGGPFGMGGQKAGEGPRRIMYVLDISHSMENRISRAERELRNALAGLQPEESFGIVAFYGRFRQFKKKLLPANPQNVAEANRFLDGLRLDNGTNLEKALKAAFSVPNLNVVVIITDGIPTYGEQDFDKLAAKVRQMNRSKARVDTVALTGSAPEGLYEDPNEIQDAARLLRQLAQDSGGESSLVTIGQ